MLDLQNIKAVCIDIDQTLLDFNACAADCIKQGLHDWNQEYHDWYFDVFKKINDGLWQQQERKELDAQTFLQIRFAKVFEALGLDNLDGPAFENKFRQYLDQSHHPIDQAEQSTALLMKEYPLFVVSNGPASQQKRRLELAGLKDDFLEVFTSEEIGVKKPDPLFFETCMRQMKAHIPDLEPHNVLVIGDSLSADMEGGKKAGWQTLWFGQKQPGMADAAASDWKEVLELLQIADK